MGWLSAALCAVALLCGHAAVSAVAQERDLSAIVLPDEDEDDLIMRPSLPPTGGLPQTVEETEPGARFFTAGQSTDEARLLAREEELRRLAIPDESVVTAPVEEGASPVSLRRRLPETFDPFAPLGIRTGPLTWFPTIDIAVGYDSNVDSSTNAREVRTARLSPELRVESDWSRHAWTGSLRGSLNYVDDGRDLDRSLADRQCAASGSRTGNGGRSARRLFADRRIRSAIRMPLPAPMARPIRICSPVGQRPAARSARSRPALALREPRAVQRHASGRWWRAVQ
jgi:hypothetical protein